MTDLDNTPKAPVLTAARVYNDLLDQMLAVTDALTACTEPWHSNKIHHLLDKRSEICASVDRCAAILDELIPQARAAGDQRIADELDLLLEQATHKLTRILQRQHECERQAVKSLEECKAELFALGRQRELKAAYSPSATPEKARFLDGRR